MQVSKRGIYAVLMALAAAACDDSDDPASKKGTGGAGGAAGSGGTAGVAGAGGSTDGGGATGGTAGSDGAAGASGASGDWSCLGKVTYPPAPAATASVSLTYFHAPKAFDPTGYGPFANMDVAACADGDPSCASPVAEGKTDTQGTVVLTLPTPGTGFAGFLRASGGGAGKTLLLQRPPIRAQSDVLVTQLIVPSAAASDALVKAAGKQPDASKGSIATVAYDCSNKATLAVSVTAASGAPTAYFQGSGEVSQQKSPNAMFVNLAPGTVNIEMKLETTGQTTASLDVPLEAGAWTFVLLAPMP